MTSFTSITSEQQCGCDKRVAKNLITFWAQIVAIYVVMVTSIVNLSLDVPDRELWLVLLSSSLGYVLPSTGLKFTSSKLTKNDNSRTPMATVM